MKRRKGTIKHYGIYKRGIGIDVIEARSERDALKKFAKVYKISDDKISGYWAENVYA